jgi:hypothetical protein
MIVLRPKLKSKYRPPKVPKKLTTPTKKVIISGFKPPRELKMVFE